MAADQDDMLTQAVERNSAAVLALPSAGMFRYHKTRFLRGEGERIWVESVAGERVLIESLVGSGDPVVVSFKSGPMKASFTSPIFELDSQYRFFENKEPIHALLMHRPLKVKAAQRRSNFRVKVRDADRFKVRLWRISDQIDVREQPTDLCELPASVLDLSVGGIGVFFKTKPLLLPNQRLRVLLSWGTREPVILDGRSGEVRHERASDTYKTGVQFQHLQESLAGRQFLTELTRTISALQLEEVKRARGNAG